MKESDSVPDYIHRIINRSGLSKQIESIRTDIKNLLLAAPSPVINQQQENREIRPASKKRPLSKTVDVNKLDKMNPERIKSNIFSKKFTPFFTITSQHKKTLQPSHSLCENLDQQPRKSIFKIGKFRRESQPQKNNNKDTSQKPEEREEQGEEERLQEWRQEIKGYLHKSQSREFQLRQRLPKFFQIQKQDKDLMWQHGKGGNTLTSSKFRAKLRSVKPQQKIISCKRISFKSDNNSMVQSHSLKKNQYRPTPETRTNFFKTRKSIAFPTRSILKSTDNNWYKERFLAGKQMAIQDDEQSLKKLANFLALEPYLGTTKLKVAPKQGIQRNRMAIDRQIREKQKQGWQRVQRQVEREQEIPTICGWQTAEVEIA